MFFLAFYAISNMSRKTNFGNKNKYIICYAISIANIFRFCLEIILKSNSSHIISLFRGDTRVFSCQYCFFAVYE